MIKNSLKGILSRLGVFGWKRIEPYIIASLITEYPLLLVGQTGDGKTYSIEKIASFMGYKETFHAYDASKVLFDDIIGFPHIETKDGKITVSYAKTPLTIWDKEFILIDEISRALPDLQNKWLEIIRNRELMGIKLDKLKYIFAAMNPQGEYIGVMGLDYALIDRFALFLRVPHFTEIPDKYSSKIPTVSEKLKITKRIKELKTLLLSIKEDYTKNLKQHNAEVSKVVNSLMKLARDGDIYYSINGRRLKMITHTVIALLTLYEKEFTKENIEEIFLSSLRYFFPFDVVYEENEVKGHIEKFRSTIQRSIREDVKTKLVNIIKSRDPVKLQLKLSTMKMHLERLLSFANNEFYEREFISDIAEIIMMMDYRYSAVRYAVESYYDMKEMYEVMEKWEKLSPYMDENTIVSLTEMWNIYCNYFFTKPFKRLREYFRYVERVILKKEE